MGQNVLQTIQSSDPDDCCLFFEGLYHDVANGINEGACGNVLIHANKSKTKEKEAEEQVRQQTEETTRESNNNSKALDC